MILVLKYQDKDAWQNAQQSRRDSVVWQDAHQQAKRETHDVWQKAHHQRN